MTIKNCVLKSSRWLVIAISSVFVGNAFAEELPLWELGLGIGALHQPYYPGSNQTRSLIFPVPSPVYRGKVFKSDDEGIRAELIDDGRYTLDMSLDFNFAIESEDLDLRSGMDDIDSLLQIGPSLEVVLAENDQDQWLLNLPLRATFEIGSDGLDESGYTFAPNIGYIHKFELGGKPWRASATLGPQFGSRDYQNVFYGVDQQFATDDRPAYQASSGYSGSRLLLAMLSKDKDRQWVWFLRYENLSGATFDDSPLFETDHSLSVGFLYSRFLFKSKKLVTR